jgi:hypothetical protein
MSRHDADSTRRGEKGQRTNPRFRVTSLLHCVNCRADDTIQDAPRGASFLTLNKLTTHRSYANSVHTLTFSGSFLGEPAWRGKSLQRLKSEEETSAHHIVKNTKVHYPQETAREAKKCRKGHACLASELENPDENPRFHRR